MLEFQEEGVLAGHKFAVFGCAISPDGSLVATGSHDRTLRIIEASTGATAHIVTHSSPVSTVAWTADGARLLAACHDGAVLEVTKNGATWAHRTVYQHKAMLVGIAVSADGTVAVTGNPKCVVWLDGNKDYETIHTFNALDGYGYRAAFSVDGALTVVGCSGGFLHIFAKDSSGSWGPIARNRQHTRFVNAIVFDAAHMLVASDDSKVSVWRLPSAGSKWPLTPTAVFNEHIGGVCGVAISADGKTGLSGGMDRTVRIWRVSDGVQEAAMEASGYIQSMAFNGKTGLMAIGLNCQGVELWRTTTAAK